MGSMTTMAYRPGISNPDQVDQTYDTTPLNSPQFTASIKSQTAAVKAICRATPVFYARVVNSNWKKGS